MKLVSALVMAGLACLIGATSAFAGGWATTLLDPLPDRLEAGHSYTVGYWVLQHGSHPSVMPLGQTGLRLVDESGSSTVYKGASLPEPAHFAAAIWIGHVGAWTVYGEQGPFAEYRVGTLHIPGGLTLAPIPPAMHMHSDEAQVWTSIRPPQPTAGTAHTHAALPVAVAPALSWSALVVRVLPGAAGLTALLALALLLLVRRARRIRGSGPAAALGEHGQA